MKTETICYPDTEAIAPIDRIALTALDPHIHLIHHIRRIHHLQHIILHPHTIHLQPQPIIPQLRQHIP